jgi:DNA-binding GntR family transcriptional regulator
MVLRSIPEASNARRTAHEYARDALRRAILRGDLATGARVPQVAWAKRLHVSTTPVREALRDLATEGIVRLDAHRGAFVSTLTFEQVCEIYRIRQILEPPALSEAAHLSTPVTLARADHLLNALADQPHVGRWTELHCEFHDTLLADLRSRRMQRMVTSLRDSVAPDVAAARRRHGTVAAHAAEHHELIEAMHARDTDRAAAVARQHLESTMADLRADRAAQRYGMAEAVAS